MRTVTNRYLSCEELKPLAAAVPPAATLTHIHNYCVTYHSIINNTCYCYSPLSSDAAHRKFEEMVRIVDCWVMHSMM